MIWIILAAGLGANLMAVALLFRRLRRDLNRQLRDMRAERNSEWILHALKEEAPERGQRAVRAVNGSGLEPVYPPPVRRKKHLGLYIGGAVAALVVTLDEGLHEVWRSYRTQLAVAVIGAAATTTVTLLPVTPGRGDAVPRPPASTMTAPPADIAPPGAVGPAPPPTAGGMQPIAGHGMTAPAGPTAAPSLMSIADEPAPAAKPSHLEPTTPLISASPLATPALPEQPPPTEEQPSPDATADLSPTSATGLCVDLSAVPILSAEACLAGGG